MPPRTAPSKLALRSAAVLALVTIPTLWIGPPKFWKLPAIDLAVIAALCLAYLLAAALAFRRASPRPPLAPWLVGLAAFGICCALLLAAEWLWPHGFASPFSRPALFSAVALALTCLMLERVAPAGRVATFAALLLAGAGLVGHVAQIKHWFGEPAPPSPDVKVAYVDTTFYELRLTAYRNWLPLTPGRLQERRNGGGLAAWGGAYLVVDQWVHEGWFGIHAARWRSFGRTSAFH
mgnify:CR=1 FL=1